MRWARLHPVLFALTLSLFGGLQGCGLANNSDAVYVDISSQFLTANLDCHFDDYKSKVESYIDSQCVSCHAANAGNLTLTSKFNSGSDVRNYSVLLDQLEPGYTQAEQTYLIRKITRGSGLSHAFQRAPSDPLVIDFSRFVQRYQSDPSCTNIDADECVDVNCYF